MCLIRTDLSTVQLPTFDIPILLVDSSHPGYGYSYYYYSETGNFERYAGPQALLRRAWSGSKQDSLSPLDALFLRQHFLADGNRYFPRNLAFEH